MNTQGRRAAYGCIRFVDKPKSSAYEGKFIEYVDTMRKIVSSYGIDHIDLYKNGFPKPCVNTGDEYTVDGLHPNDNGYDFLLILSVIILKGSDYDSQ